MRTTAHQRAPTHTAHTRPAGWLSIPRVAATGALAFCLALLAVPAQAARLALVIGNDAYAHVDRLKNARNDARLMAQALTEAGFEVVGGVRTDLGRKALWAAIDQFKDRIRSGDEVVFYFAGHGIDAEGALLLPVDIENGNQDEIKREAVALRELPSKFKSARFSLLVIDACRDNPFPKKADGTRAFGDGSRGLGRPPQADMPEGSMVLLAASAGQKALDHVPGENVANGLFTHEFVRAIRTPGQDVFAAIRQTRTQVYAKAKTKGHDQRPALSEENTIGDPFVFIASAKPDPQPPRPQPLQPGQAFKDCADCPELVVIPAGRFTMGSGAAEQKKAQEAVVPKEWTDRESPQRSVSVGRFAAGKYAVTKGEFGRFVLAQGYKTEAERGGGCLVWTGSEWKTQADKNWRNPGFAQGDDHPVVCVSWNDVQAYVQWLSQSTGKAYRLLSEAEREYAARAGSQAAYWWGDSISTAQGNYNGNHSYNGSPKGEYRQATVAVNSFAPNPFGLYNVHGNVWEWVQDCFEDNYSAGQPTDGSAHRGNDSGCPRRVLRGGSWVDYPDFLRSAFRFWFTPVYRSSNFGFRLARTVP